MRIRTLLSISLLATACTVSAEQSALEGAAKQMLKDKATEAAPKEAVQGVKATDQAIEKAKTLKESAEKAPAAAQEQAKEAVKQKVQEAVPEEAKQGAKAVKKGAKTAKKAKKALEDPSKTAEEAAGAAKEKAQQEATDKALELLE